MLGTGDRALVKQLLEALVVGLGPVHDRPGLAHVRGLEGVKELAVHQTQTCAGLCFDSLRLLEQIDGIPVVHAHQDRALLDD